MKLFGNKRDAARLGKKAGVPGSDRVGKRRLTGMQRGMILLMASLLILTGTVVAVYKSFVRPVEIVQPEMVEKIPEGIAEETNAFVPPTTVKMETKVDEETGEEITVEVEVPASHKEAFYNILIVGTDGDGLRTDTIMIGRLDVEAHTVALLSIPRDTLIECDYSVPKINGVYGYEGGGKAGITALKTKLAELLGFEVDGYALVNLDAFIELVDLVGGVEFDVPMDMDYEDVSQNLYIHLKAGMQHLDGKEAMQLVRYRKGYATQDIQRTKVQQEFLQTLAKKCISVVNLAKIGDMAEIFQENVTTELTLGNIAYFGQELLKCDFENMFSYTLEGEGVMVKDASCYALYRNRTLAVMNEYFNPYEAEIREENVSIRTPEDARAEQALWEAEQGPEEELPPEELPEDILPGDEPEEDEFWGEGDIWFDEEFWTEKVPSEEELWGDLDGSNEEIWP